MRADQITERIRYDRSSGLYPRIKSMALLTAVLLLLMTFLSACTGESDDEPVRLADYGSYGADFARELAARYPGRSPGSVSERAAGDMIIKHFKDLGYEPVVETFHFEIKADSEASETDENSETAASRYYSRNIIVQIPGTGFLTSNDEVISRQIIIGAHYDTAIGIDKITPDTDEQEIDDPDAEVPDDQDQSPDEADENTFENDLVYEDLEQNWTLYDGIHDNASGIGVLMNLARMLSQETLAYDVVLVAFGAGEANLAGSHTFASGMSRDEIERTDAMYEINAVYAGDKVYAHAGWNALISEEQKDYDMRRKLYELTDVFYDHELYTNNRFMLYTNQSSFFLALPTEMIEEEIPESEPEESENDSIEESEENDESEPIPEAQPARFIYREWTIRESDYRSFDKLGIPVVMFDSGDYNINDLADFRESNNPAFASTGGIISQTAFDSSAVLSFVFDEPDLDDLSAVNQEEEVILDEAEQTDNDDIPEQIDQLRHRINNISFLILEAAKKGTHLIDQVQTDEESDGPLSASEN